MIEQFEKGKRVAVTVRRYDPVLDADLDSGLRPVKVEQEYDRSLRSWRTMLLTADGAQVGTANYDGNRADAAASKRDLQRVIDSLAEARERAAGAATRAVAAGENPYAEARLTDALAGCNGCDVEDADPADPRGYGPACQAASAAQDRRDERPTGGGIAKPVVVGLGHDIHLTLRRDTKAEYRTYCGRGWTADTQDGIDITCRPCRKAYAAGRHPSAPALYPSPAPLPDEDLHPHGSHVAGATCFKCQRLGLPQPWSTEESGEAREHAVARARHEFNVRSLKDPAQPASAQPKEAPIESFPPRAAIEPLLGARWAARAFYPDGRTAAACSHRHDTEALAEACANRLVRKITRRMAAQREVPEVTDQIENENPAPVDPRKDPRLNDTAFVETEEGQALLEAAQKADKEARRASRKAKDAADRAEKAAREAAAAEARKPGPVEVVRAGEGTPAPAPTPARKPRLTVVTGGKAKPAPKPKAAKAPKPPKAEKVPAAPKAAKPVPQVLAMTPPAEPWKSVEAQLAAIAAAAAEMRAAGKANPEAPVLLPIFNRDGTLAAHQNHSYAWKCPTCGSRVRAAKCEGAVQKHPATKAPAGFRVEDRIV